MDNMKRQKDVTLEDEPPHTGLKVPNMLLGENRGQSLIAPKRIKWLGKRKYDTQLLMRLVVKVKPDAVEDNIA